MRGTEATSARCELIQELEAVAFDHFTSYVNYELSSIPFHLYLNTLLTYVYECCKSCINIVPMNHKCAMGCIRS